MRETRSGIKPDESRLPYVITPNDVKNYLQKRIDIVLNEARKNGEYVPDVNIQDVISIDVTSDFIPLVLFLPESAVQINPVSEYKGNSIFNTNNDSKKKVKLIKPVYNALKAYVYNDEDRKSFGTVTMKNTLKMSREKIYRIQEWSTPTVFNTKRNVPTSVVLLIDPIRIFYDMLKYVGNEPAKPFRIVVEDTKKRENGYYKYYIRREEITPKKEKKDLAVELERRMRSINRG